MRASKFFTSAVRPVVFSLRGDDSPTGLEGWSRTVASTVTVRGVLQEKVGSVDNEREVVFGTGATATLFVPLAEEEKLEAVRMGDTFVGPKGLEYQVTSITPVAEAGRGKVFGDYSVVVRGVKQ